MSTVPAVFYTTCGYVPVYYASRFNTPFPRIDLTRRGRADAWRALLDELRYHNVTSKEHLYRVGWRVQKVVMRFDYPGLKR